VEVKTKKPFFFEGRKRTRLITFSVCFVIASIFWIFNALSSDYSTTINYPAKLVYNKNEIVSMQPNFKKVELAVTGYGWTLLSLTLGLDLAPIVVTPSDLNEENMIYSSALMLKSKYMLKDIKVNQVITDSLHFDIDKVETKKLILKLDTKRLSLPSGKTITKPKIEPGFITCTGPRKVIFTLPDTISFAIPDGFIEKGFKDKVRISYKPSQYIKLSDSEVMVSFKIKP